MIPKIIHYCWFGRNPKPQLVLDCIESWKKFCPDYEIREWNEDNFDINCCNFVMQAYGAKKWAFVADYARLYALRNYGGVYLDTDVELFKPIDRFLESGFFAGFESNDIVGTAIFGAIKNNELICSFAEWYENVDFIQDDGKRNVPPNTFVLTDFIRDLGFDINGKEQSKNGISLYPQKMFYPNGITRVFNIIPKSAYSVHHAEQSWMDNPKSAKSFLGRVRRFVVGALRNAVGTTGTYELKQKILRLLKLK